VSQFFKGIFHNLEWQANNERSSVNLSKIRLRSEQELTKLLSLLCQASQFKTLEIDIEIELYFDTIDEILSAFGRSIDIPSNTQLKVHLFLADSKWGELPYEQWLFFSKIPHEFHQIQSSFRQSWKV